MRALLFVGRWAWVGVIALTMVFGVQYLRALRAYEDSSQLANDVSAMRQFQERMLDAGVSEWLEGGVTDGTTSGIAAEADTYIADLILEHDLLADDESGDRTGFTIVDALRSANRELLAVSQLSQEEAWEPQEIALLGRLFGSSAGGEASQGPLDDLALSPAQLATVYGSLSYATSNAKIIRYIDDASLAASARADQRFAAIRRSGEIGMLVLMVVGVLAAIGYAWTGHRARRERWEVKRASERAALGSEFVSLASHELRTPLVGLYGFSELLLEDETLPRRARDWAERIHRESARLTRIVEDLLDVSRIESGRMEVRREAVNFGEVLDSVYGTFEAVSPLHHLRIRGELEIEVVGDRDKLVEVLSNLVDNAIKYSIDGGLVIIESRVVRDRLEVRVIDEGVGIPEELREAIFERFGRLRRSETEHVRSTGLGLFLVQEVLSLMESTISVESNERNGSTFVFSLPLVTDEFVEASDDALAA